MALLATLTLTANGRESLRLYNHPTGQANRVSYIASGTFDSGTVSVQLSPDAGSTWVDNIDNGSPVAFTAADARAIEANSDSNAPVVLGFNLTGATSPSITIKVYDNR